MLDLRNIDCLQLMKEFPDGYFDLAIADPPYGVGYARGKNGWGVCDNRPTLQDVKWDNQTPTQEYFTELQRVSKNQIVWGGNYFTDKLPVSKCWIVWNKVNTTENKSVFADAELAWTSFSKVVKMYVKRQMGFISDTNDSDRIHPTQKPTELYRWLLQNYAEKGQKILDTHLGSGSIAIACHHEEFDLVGSEINTEYFNKMMKRIQQDTAQTSLF